MLSVFYVDSMEDPVVKLFMRNGYPTPLCFSLPKEMRRRMFRICRVLGRREYNRMLREWVYDETVEVIRYEG